VGNSHHRRGVDGRTGVLRSGLAFRNGHDGSTDSSATMLDDPSSALNARQGDSAGQETQAAVEGDGALVILWCYEVKPECREAFLRHYAEDGTWEILFRRAPGYLGTELLGGTDSHNRFMTIDRWRSAADHAEFLRTHQAQYRAIDKMCERLTVSERPLGEYRRAGSIVHER
jgi:heme-degrading monooxygenase HmoA